MRTGIMTVGDLRESRMDHILRTGDYDAAYCQLCHCNRSDDPDDANSVTEACETSRCPCHGEAAGHEYLVTALVRTAREG